MAKDFWIDQSDPPFPTIRHRTHADRDEFDDLMSLTEARRRIKEICRNHRDHWLKVMNQELDRSSEKIIREAIEDIGFSRTEFERMLRDDEKRLGKSNDG